MFISIGINLQIGDCVVQLRHHRRWNDVIHGKLLALGGPFITVAALPRGDYAQYGQNSKEKENPNCLSNQA